MVSIRGKGWFAEGPLVSVVVPTFNSGKTLALCLQSIRSQTYANVETIVVDNYSRDNTVRIAEEFDARVLLLASERSSARNLGAEEAQGDFVFFVDSDMELTPKVVEECVMVCLQKGVNAVIVPELFGGEGFLAECRKMEREMRVRDRFSEAPRFFRRGVFQSVGGFDENLVSGEDFDLGLRVERGGHKIGRVGAEIKHCEGELSMKRIVLKTYYYGKTLPYYVRKNPSLAMKTSCPIRYLRNFKMFREHPIQFMGFVVIKLVEYIAYVTGALSMAFSG